MAKNQRLEQLFGEARLRRAVLVSSELRGFQEVARPDSVIWDHSGNQVGELVLQGLRLCGSDCCC